MTPTDFSGPIRNLYSTYTVVCNNLKIFFVKDFLQSGNETKMVKFIDSTFIKRK
jgi:hypothetical protein